MIDAPPMTSYSVTVEVLDAIAEYLDLFTQGKSLKAMQMHSKCKSWE